MKPSQVIFFVLMFAVSSTANLLCAQNHKKLDRLIKQSENIIYSNPDDVIRTGEIIISESGENVDYKIKGYKLMSDAYSAKRDYEKSVEYLIKASRLLEFSDDKLLEIKIINKAGILYHQLKVYDKAMQYLDQAEQLIADYPDKDSIHIELGKNYIVRGFIYKEKLSCAIAITYLDRGIAEFMKAKNKSDSYSKLSIAIYNKGNCYLLLKNNALAFENFQKAADIARKVNAKSLEAFALKGSANVFFLQGKHDQAIAYLNKALALSPEVNDLILNQEIYRGLCENYLALNQLDKFMENQLKFIETQKSIKATERVSVSESLESKEREFDSKKIRLSNNFYYLVVFLSAVFVLIIIFFYFMIKRKRAEADSLKQHIHALQNQKAK